MALLRHRIAELLLESSTESFREAAEACRTALALRAALRTAFTTATGCPVAPPIHNNRFAFVQFALRRGSVSCLHSCLHTPSPLSKEMCAGEVKSCKTARLPSPYGPLAARYIGRCAPPNRPSRSPGFSQPGLTWAELAKSADWQWRGECDRKCWDPLDHSSSTPPSRL